MLTPPTPGSSNRSQIIKLPHRHPLEPQQTIRRRNMKVEIRQREIHHIAPRRKLVLPALRLDHNLPLLLPVDALLGHRFQDLNRLLDPRLELLEGGFVVGHGDGVGAGDAGGGVFGAVAYALDLVGEGAHVGD